MGDLHGIAARVGWGDARYEQDSREPNSGTGEAGLAADWSHVPLRSSGAQLCLGALAGAQLW